MIISGRDPTLYSLKLVMRYMFCSSLGVGCRGIFSVRQTSEEVWVTVDERRNNQWHNDVIVRMFLVDRVRFPSRQRHLCTSFLYIPELNDVVDLIRCATKSSFERSRKVLEVCLFPGQKFSLSDRVWVKVERCKVFVNFSSSGCKLRRELGK